MKRIIGLGICSGLLILLAALLTTGSIFQSRTGTWTVTQAMAEPRSGASTVLLADDRLLVTGGTGSRDVLASAEVFDNTGAFSPVTSMYLARSHHTSTLLPDGRVLVAGGKVRGGGATNEAEVYNPLTDSWTIIASLVEPRFGHTASMLPDGRVLLAGGEGYTGPSSTLELFDPVTGSFSSAGVLSTGRKHHAAAVLSDGRVLIAGGSNGSAALSSVEIYDGDTGSVLPGPNLSSPRSGLTATTLLNGNVLIAGGSDGGDLATAEIYDASTQAFVPLAATLATPRHGHLAFRLPHNNTVLLVGGTAGGVPVASAERFIPWQERFIEGDSLAVPRAEATGSPLALEGLLLVAGGSAQASAELYRFATVKTDKDDYAPGEKFTITGTGWQPNELVELVFHEEPSTHADRRVKVRADGSGNILHDSFQPQLQDAGVTFYLTAVGASSQAQTSFTDKPAGKPGTGTATTTSMTSSANPSVFGQGVVFTATVTASGGKKSPGGEVQFKIDGANFGSPVPVVACGSRTSCASISISTLSVGLHSVEAAYSGSGSFKSSTGILSGGQTVTKASTTTTLVSSANPSGVGEPVTFTATVGVVSPGGGMPTGTVTFFDGGLSLGTGALTSEGWTTFSTSSLAAGSHSITAVYAGDENFDTSNSSSLLQTVGKVASTTVLVSSLNPSVLGESVTFTATVSGPEGAGVPTGTVTFFDGGINLGSGTLNAEGWTTLSASSLAVGSHSLTAVYSGDQNFDGSSSSILVQTVGKVASTTVLVSSLNPSVLGESVTFTATVSGPEGAGVPTGTVTFFDGGISLGSGTLNAQGWTTLSTSSLTVGAHSITAVYSGDGNFAGSTSTILLQTVNAASTTTTLASSTNPSVVGESVTFTATVSGPEGAGVPTGTVTFLDGGISLGSGTLNAQGWTTFNTSSLAVGSHSVTAVYSGDSNFAGSTAAALLQTVSQGATATALVSSTNPSVAGESVTFTATVGVVAPAVGTPTGTVTFLDGFTTLGTGTLNAQGWTTLNTSALSVGLHSITAVYSGDGNFSASTSVALTQTVNEAPKPATTTALASSTNPSVVGGSVTFTATVSGPVGAGVPSGTVTFFDGGINLGTGTLTAGGWTTLSTSSLAVGSHSITAVYSGDANFTGSTSAIVTQAVNPGATTAALVSSTNPSVAGESVTFTATVGVVAPAVGTPTGTVTFFDGGTNLGTNTLTAGGWTTLSTSSLAVGSHSLTAVYSGDGNFASSTSSALTQSVNQGVTTTALVSSTNPSPAGDSVTFTATVSVVAPAAGTPTGTVTFFDGGVSVGSGTLTAGGWTTLTTSSLSAGSHSLTAVYAGDGNFAGSTSAVLTQTVN